MSKTGVLRSLTSLIIVFWIVVSACILTGAYFAIWFYEDRIFETEKSNITEMAFDSIRDAEKAVSAINALFTSTPDVDSDGFRIVAEQILEQTPTMESLRLVSIVSQEEIKVFESTIQKVHPTYSYLGHFQKKSTNFDVLTQFYEPLTPTTTEHLGENLLEDKKLSEGVMGAIKEGRDHIVGPFINEHGATVIYVIKAIYSGKVYPLTEDLRVKSAIGAVISEMNISKILNAIKLESGHYLALYVRTMKNDKMTETSIIKQDKIDHRNVLYFGHIAAESIAKISDNLYSLKLTKVIRWSFEKVAIFFLTITGLTIIAFLSYFRVKAFMDIQSEIQSQVEQKTKIIEEQRAQMISSARMASLGEMAGGVAHEINNPLLIIRMLAEQLKRDILQENQNKNIVLGKINRIDETVTRIAAIISGLLSFSRDADNDENVEVLVSKIINNTLYFCQEKLQKEGVNIIIEPIPHSLMIRCKEVQISQVLLNILNNAFDATATSSDKWIRIAVKEGTENVSISITDSGQGIPPEMTEKIFYPFMTTKPVGKGTGLGLSISKGIIEKHKGSIVLDRSCPNTCFVVTLPK